MRNSAAPLSGPGAHLRECLPEDLTPTLSRVRTEETPALEDKQQIVDAINAVLVQEGFYPPD